MINSIKKSFNIIKDNPFITLYFVLYLIVLFLIIPFLAGRNIILGMIIGVLILLLTCAFVSGWFNMIKASTVHYKENKTPEEKLDEAIKLKNDFFCGVSGYILPVIAGTILIIALFYLHSYLSDLIFGKIDSVIYEMSKYTNDTEALRTYFVSLPNSTWALIFKKGIFSYVVCNLITLFFLYWGASLYLNKYCSTNPFFAIVDSIKVMFKKFPQTLIVFIILTAVNFILISLQAIFIENVVISFITMILRIYFAAYMIVLIFDLYESDKAKICERICAAENNSDNRADSLGENSVSD